MGKNIEYADWPDKIFKAVDESKGGTMRELLERAERARDPWGDALYGLDDDVSSMEKEIGALSRKFQSESAKKRLAVLLKMLKDIREAIDASYSAGAET